MTCTHRRPTYGVWAEVEVSPWGDTEMQLVETGGESTCVDISIGSFRCTQCGHVGYYTGSWKNYAENGTPCPGSESVSRDTLRGRA